MMLAIACLASALCAQSRFRANGYSITLPHGTAITVVAVAAPGGRAWSPSGGELTDEGKRGLAALKRAGEIWRNVRPQIFLSSRPNVIMRLTSPIPFQKLAFGRIGTWWQDGAHEAFLIFALQDLKTNLAAIEISVGERPWATLAVARHVGQRFISDPGFDMKPQVRQVTEPGRDPYLNEGGIGSVGVKCRYPEVDLHPVTSLAGGRSDDAEDSVDTRLIVYFRDGSSDTGGGTSGSGAADMKFAGTVGAIDRIEFQAQSRDWVRFDGIHTSPNRKRKPLAVATAIINPQ